MKKWVTTTAALLICLFSFAQSRVITGTVTEVTGEPLAGCSIVIKGTRTGTSTDNKGQFHINAKTGDVLVVSYVGFETKEVRLESSSSLSIVLEKSRHSFSTEVVVTALGSGVQKKSLSYSVTTVNGDDADGKKFGLKTWKRSGGLDENSVRLSVGEKDFIPVQSVQVAVKVDGFRARVLFDFFFYSNKQRRLRGDFKLKLPAGASPCYFAFGGKTYIDSAKNISAPFVSYPASSPLVLEDDTIRTQRTANGQTLREALLAPKAKAAYAFNEVVRGRIDPALMEWAGADIFSCSVFPVEPGKLHRVVIGYDINLSESGDLSVLNLSLPFGSIPKKLDLDIIHHLFVQHLIVPVIANPSTVENYTRYHTENFKAQSFSINLRSEKKIFLQNSGPDTYFALTTEAQLPLSPAGKVAENAVFLLDVSLSSQPDKFNVWLKMLEEILSNNRKTIKRFAVLYFNTSSSWWHDYYSDNNAYNVGDFLEFADRLSLMGATDLGQALKTAAQPEWQKDKQQPKTIYLLSDGDASWGENNLYQLSGLVPADNKIFAFTTGLPGTDTRTLDHLCRESNGAVFSVLNEEEAEKIAQSLQFQPWRIKSIELPGTKDILIAGRPYNIFSGQKLLITGRGAVQPGAALQIHLQQGNKEKTIQIAADYISNSGLTARIYGQTAVTQLEDFSFRTEKAAVNYATYFKVAGQTCSWLMLESDALYRRYGISTEQSKSFIDSTLVTDLISEVLKKEAAEKTLGSAKEDMKAWMNKLQQDKEIDFMPDSLLTSYINSLPEHAFMVDVQAIKPKLHFRDEWLASSNEAVNSSVLDYDEVMRAVKNEKAFGGRADAFTLISSFAENNRGDLTLLRDVAFQLSNWGLDGKAYELCKRIIAARPAEPPTYKQIAASLLKMGNIDLAILYYDIAYKTSWDNRFDGFDIINELEYYKLLKAVNNGKYHCANLSFVNKRLSEISKDLDGRNISADEADLMIVITWNTDNTDVDLHVREPNKQECYYGYKRTTNGGLLTNDAVEGFGPETYILKKAVPGTYALDIDYYSSSRVQTSARSKIFVTVYKNWGRQHEEVLQKVVELKRSEKKANNRGGNDDDKTLKDVFVITF